MFFFSSTDLRPLSKCNICGVSFPISKAWQKFCSLRCQWRWNKRHGQSGRTQRLRRRFMGFGRELGTLNNDYLKVISYQGQPRIKGAILLQRSERKSEKKRGKAKPL